MTVELEKGKSENIKIYRDSKPDELAFDFCKLHNLDFSSLTYLTTQIKKLFETIQQGTNSIINNNQSNEMNTFDKFLFVCHLLHWHLSSSLVVEGLLSALCSNQCS